MSIIQKLADSFSGCKYEDIPEDVREIARKSLLDAAGCAVAGSTTEPLLKLQKFIFSSPEGTGESTVCGLDKSASLLGAALINASQADDMEYADVNKEGGGHPGAMVVPTALNMAEYLQATGKELLSSVAIGYEAHRITVPLYPKAFRQGIHLCMIGGTFGAAATAASLLKLDNEEFANALGICAIAPVAPFEPCRVGGDVKDLYTGWASRSGIFAALLAKNSFSGTPSLAEGELGLHRALGAERDSEDALRDLGKDWFVIKGTCIKPHSACRFTHSPADCALELMKKYPIKPDEIKSITITTDTVPYQLNRGPLPQDAIAARFSIPYVVATVILKGRPASIEDFTQNEISNPITISLASKVKTVLDKELDKDYAEPPLGIGHRTAIMKMELVSGKVYETRIDYPLGDPKNPVSWEQVQDKFLRITVPIIGEQNAFKFARMVKNIEKVENCQELVKLLSKSN